MVLGANVGKQNISHYILSWWQESFNNAEYDQIQCKSCPHIA
uniref:Uncharacterized protein n=1 Tax=Arundo donax TaxID=35708 RepID=A0A0A8Z2R8_ARUDO